MASSSDFPARGKIIRVEEGYVLFAPVNTNYELKLPTDGKYTGPINTPIECLIRVQARRLWTVQSGGNFISPISGPPKTIQGRIRLLDEQSMVVHAGTDIIVSLPKEDTAMDLSKGPLTVGRMVNVVVFVGATVELLQPV